MIQKFPHLGIYPREMKTYINTENYTQLCIASLFVVSPNWKQPKSPSTWEYTEQTVAHLNDGILLDRQKEHNVHTCNNLMNLKGSMLSEGSQSQIAATL